MAGREEGEGEERQGRQGGHVACHRVSAAKQAPLSPVPRRRRQHKVAHGASSGAAGDGGEPHRARRGE